MSFHRYNAHPSSSEILLIFECGIFDAFVDYFPLSRLIDLYKTHPLFLQHLNLSEILNRLQKRWNVPGINNFKSLVYLYDHEYVTKRSLRYFNSHRLFYKAIVTNKTSFIKKNIYNVPIKLSHVEKALENGHDELACYLREECKNIDLNQFTYIKVAAKNNCYKYLSNVCSKNHSANDINLTLAEYGKIDGSIKLEITPITFSVIFSHLAKRGLEKEVINLITLSNIDPNYSIEYDHETELISSFNYDFIKKHRPSLLDRKNVLLLAVEYCNISVLSHVMKDEDIKYLIDSTFDRSNHYYDPLFITFILDKCKESECIDIVIKNIYRNSTNPESVITLIDWCNTNNHKLPFAVDRVLEKAICWTNEILIKYLLDQKYELSMETIASNLDRIDEVCFRILDQHFPNENLVEHLLTSQIIGWNASDLIERLFQLGSRINCNSILKQAAIQDKINIVRIMLESGKCSKESINSAFTSACLYAHKELIHLLLKQGIYSEVIRKGFMTIPKYPDMQY